MVINKLSVVIKGYQQVINGYQWLSRIINGCQSVINDYQWLLVINKLSVVIKGYKQVTNGYQSVINGCRLSTSYQWLSMVIMDH